MAGFEEEDDRRLDICTPGVPQDANAPGARRMKPGEEPVAERLGYPTVSTLVTLMTLPPLQAPPSE